METTSINAYQKVQQARHPERPYTLDILETVFENFIEIHGDRRFADDSAMICGFAKIEGKEVAVIGQQKGRDTNQRKKRNFGMPKPEGYRKALRVMKLAEKFQRPIVTFIDTPGAYPGIDAEERGQAEAIAFNLREMAHLKVPIVVVVLGEGGSGGALAIGVGDVILMMENAVYSVISPEGCAAILWKDAGQANLAAESLRLTAEDLKQTGLIDEIIPEPVTWKIEKREQKENDKGKDAFEGFDFVASHLKKTIKEQIDKLETLSVRDRIKLRLKKFRAFGEWV